MRAFLFEEVLLLTEPVEREGRLPQYRCIFEGQVCDFISKCHILDCAEKRLQHLEHFSIHDYAKDGGQEV